MSLIPKLSRRACRPHAPFAELVKLSVTSITEEMRAGDWYSLGAPARRSALASVPLCLCDACSLALTAKLHRTDQVLPTTTWLVAHALMSMSAIEGGAFLTSLLHCQSLFCVFDERGLRGHSAAAFGLAVKSAHGHRENSHLEFGPFIGFGRCRPLGEALPRISRRFRSACAFAFSRRSRISFTREESSSSGNSCSAGWWDFSTSSRSSALSALASSF